MKKILQTALYLCARAILTRYTPDVIGVTGSVGKTSAKEAIALVLSSRYAVRQSEKNYNNEIGVPLTIIGARSGHRSFIGWLAVFLKAIRLIFLKKNASYPQIVILEMGADRPGDIEYLTRLAPCTIGVLTAIGPAHLEKFGTMEKLIREKQIMVNHLQGENRWAVITADDPLVLSSRDYLSVPALTFGFKEGADVFVEAYHQEAVFLPDKRESIHSAITVQYKNAVEQIEINTVGTQAVCSILPALAIGFLYHIPFDELASLLRSYQQPKGRMRFLSGIKHTLIIDDSYNSSPLAARAALDALISFEINEDARRIAVLGDMLELGKYTEKEHIEIGSYVASTEKIDILMCVGVLAGEIAKGARHAGFDESKIFCFNDAVSAQKTVQASIKKGDVILVKGSQGVRLERIVKEIMAEPERAKDFLVRQGEEWE